MKSEQRLCYEAEDSVLPFFAVSLDAHAYLPNNLEKYVEVVTTREWFKEQFRNHREITVKKGKRPNAKSSVTHNTKKRSTIVICVKHRTTRQLCEEVVLHELAHAVTKEPGHGHTWRANFVFIVRKQMGYKQAQMLRDAFVKNELPFRDWSMESQRR